MCFSSLLLKLPQGESLDEQNHLGGPGGRAPWWGSGAKPLEAKCLLSDKIVIEALQEHVFRKLKMTEKLILTTPVHENSPYYLIFPFLKSLGLQLPTHPPPHDLPLVEAELKCRDYLLTFYLS